MIDRTEHPRRWLTVAILLALAVTTTVVASATSWVVGTR